MYSFDGTEAFSCGEFYWFYDKCLYGYNGNGLIVYDGGMGREHLEYVTLYTFENNRLEWTKMLKTSEDCSYDELRKYLSNYTLIPDFCSRECLFACLRVAYFSLSLNASTSASLNSCDGTLAQCPEASYFG